MMHRVKISMLKVKGLIYKGSILKRHYWLKKNEGSRGREGGFEGAMSSNYGCFVKLRDFCNCCSYVLQLHISTSILIL